MTIHREGFRTLGFSFLFLFLLNLLAYFFFSRVIFCSVGMLSILLFGILLQFFRHPSFVIPVNETHLLAPADGRVVVIEEAFEPEYFKDKRLQVSIFMSPFNVHVNRYPLSGKIKFFRYHPGLFLVAWHPKSSTENERTTLVISNGNKEILVRQIAGALARRIVCYCSEGDKVVQGEELGFIKFGSRVDVFMPLGTKTHVKLGDKVKGGRSVIAAFNTL